MKTAKLGLNEAFLETSSPRFGVYLYACPSVVFLRVPFAVGHEVSRPANRHYRPDQPTAHRLALLRLRRRAAARPPGLILCARPDHQTAQKSLNLYGFWKESNFSESLINCILESDLVVVFIVVVVVCIVCHVVAAAAAAFSPQFSPGCARARHKYRCSLVLCIIS